MAALSFHPVRFDARIARPLGGAKMHAQPRIWIDLYHGACAGFP
jgi:hypothetical protein